MRVDKVKRAYARLADQPEIEIDTILPAEKFYARDTQDYARSKVRLA